MALQLSVGERVYVCLLLGINQLMKSLVTLP